MPKPRSASRRACVTPSRETCVLLHNILRGLRYSFLTARITHFVNFYYDVVLCASADAMNQNLPAGHPLRHELVAAAIAIDGDSVSQDGRISFPAVNMGIVSPNEVSFSHS